MDDKNSLLDKFICECGNEYKYRQGLWKHKNKCSRLLSPKMSSLQTSNSDFNILTNLVLDVVKQNKELTQQNNELTNKIVDICKISHTNICNSNIKNHTINRTSKHDAT
jgi:hypothetical protein